jgi:hypothetical protein
MSTRTFVNHSFSFYLLIKLRYERKLTECIFFDAGIDAKENREGVRVLV